MTNRVGYSVTPIQKEKKIIFLLQLTNHCNENEIWELEEKFVLGEWVFSIYIWLNYNVNGKIR